MDQGRLVASKTPLTWPHPDAQRHDIADVNAGARNPAAPRHEDPRRDLQRVHGVGQGISVIIERA
jgi:hypothetical protein